MSYARLVVMLPKTGSITISSRFGHGSPSLAGTRTLRQSVTRGASARTAHADGGQLSFADDPYGKDAGVGEAVMALQ